MRVLVAWASDVSPNLGVRALARGSVDVIRRAWPDAQVELIDFGRRPPQLPWGQTRSLIKERVTGRTGMMAWLSQFDVLWDTRSGDSFTDIYSGRRNRRMSLLHEFAVQAGCRAVIAPQTLGPFTTRTGRAMARRTLHRSTLVFARDSVSDRAATSLGRPADALATDMVFGVDQPVDSESHDVLLNVSGLLWQENSHIDATSYRAQVRRIVDELHSEGRSVTLFPHVIDSVDADNDVPVSHELAQYFGSRVDVRIPTDLDDARTVLSGAQVVIGARMHACLNALSTGTPAVAMSYSRKFRPLMADIEWNRVVSITDDDAAAQVLAAVNDTGLEPAARRTQARGQSALATIFPHLDRIT